MDHRKIEAENIPERYVRGTLSDEDAEAFEQHFLQCSWCLERVQSTERILQGLRHLAADDESWSGLPPEPPSRVLLPSRPIQLLLAALVLLLILPLAFKLSEVQKLRSNLHESRTAWMDAQQEAQIETTERLATHRQQQASAREALEEARLLDEAMEAEENRREELRSWLAEASEPQINTPVFALSFIETSKQQKLVLPTEPCWMVFSLDPGPGDVEFFRVSLKESSGVTLWSMGDLEPDYRGLLNLSIHSSTVPEGRYRLHLEDEHGNPRTLELRISSQAS